MANIGDKASDKNETPISRPRYEKPVFHVHRMRDRVQSANGPIGDVCGCTPGGLQS